MANAKKKCKWCSVYFAAEGMVKTPRGTFCISDHAYEFAKFLQIKNRQKAHREKVRNFRMQDKRHQLALTQSEFNAFIRALDKDKGCISCNKGPEWGGQWHAGHYKTTAARPDLRFDPLNCYKQCSICNNYLSGNLVPYRERLWRDYGQWLLDYLDQDKQPQKATSEGLAALRQVFAAETRLLVSGQPPSRDWRIIKK